MGKLDGKVAVVTGASRGIGKAIAELFAAEGARVICAARTVSEGEHQLEGSLQTTVNGIRAAGGEATAIACNVSDPEQCEALIKQAGETYGRLDVLVNNAAMNHYAPVADYPPTRWLRGFAVNVHGPFFLCHFALPEMILRRSGSIVNISSNSATGPGRGPYDRSGDGSTMYGASKAALERFTQGLAEEVWQYGISVSAFAPSEFVLTPGTAFHRDRINLAGLHDEPPEMMARAALLLATEPFATVSGRVTYSQAILQEFGWIDGGRGTGIERPGSGYSTM